MNHMYLILLVINQLVSRGISIGFRPKNTLLHPKNKSTCSDGTWHSPSLQLELKVSPSRITNIIGIITLCPRLMYLTDKIMLKYGSVIVVGITLLCWEDKISCPLDVHKSLC